MTLWTHAPYDRGPLPDSQNVVGGYRVTSWFGNRPDPFTGRTSGHGGMDLALPAGTPLYAVADGSLIRGWDPGGGGNWGTLWLSSTERIGYGHCDRWNHKIQDGRVEAGTLIGWSGNTGRSTGAHLHLSYDDDDPDPNYDDPYDQLVRVFAAPAPPAVEPTPEPIPEPEADMPLTDADAALVALKVGELLSGRAQAEGQEWAKAADGTPYPSLTGLIEAEGKRWLALVNGLADATGATVEWDQGTPTFHLPDKP